jgi:hypothetical protein
LEHVRVRELVFEQAYSPYVIKDWDYSIYHLNMEVIDFLFPYTLNEEVEEWAVDIII